MHGGRRGFDKVPWTGEPFESDGGVGVRLRYTSPDGEEGYAGTLAVRVTYTLTSRDELVVDYEATTDKATPVNLSQHTYWNMAPGAARRRSPARPIGDGCRFPAPSNVYLVCTPVLRPFEGLVSQGRAG